MKFLCAFLFLFLALAVSGQGLKREYTLKEGGQIDITNRFGRVYIQADEEQGEKASLLVEAGKSFTEKDLVIKASDNRLEILAEPASSSARIDLTLKVPIRTRLRIETRDGEVRIGGNVASANVETYSGTISTSVPLDSVKYDFLWTASHPRYLSDVQLPKGVEEKSGGRFVLAGKLGEAAEKDKKKKSEGDKPESDVVTESSDPGVPQPGDKPKDKEKKEKKDKAQIAEEKRAKLRLEKNIALSFVTARGIVLLNVSQADVPNDLRERPLTDAARAIVRSGDSILMEAIRRASPKYFGDYLKTLPPRKAIPSLGEKVRIEDKTVVPVKRVVVKVTDFSNRAISGLSKSDFSVNEKGIDREVLGVEQTNAPFNLVLLLDVSGSIENYVDFIRKAARNFIGTMRPDDRIAILIFNENVKQISTFTADRGKLSESLDTFDAGGGTAYYDALAYSLVETLAPLKGERTAVVILSDGDDNRSFLPFEPLIGSIQESGALIYPLYVPSGLIAASKNSDPNKTVDPLRTRYMGLTTRAEDEGAQLAHISGGVYYPIRRLEELQKAYEDIAIQLRTAYVVTFRSGSEDPVGRGVSPRLKVKVGRDNVFVSQGAVIEVPKAEADKYEKKEVGENKQP